MRLGITFIDKLDSLEAYPRARENTFQSKTIENNFKAISLVQLDPEPVLSKLNILFRSPTPLVERPTSKSNLYCRKTPRTIVQLSKHAKLAKKLLEDPSGSSLTLTKEIVNKAYKAWESVTKSMLLLKK
jgi:hypothetical protein